MAIQVRDVINGTEITINSNPPKFYSLHSELVLQTTSQNAPLDAAIGGARINEYFTIITRHGKSVSLPFLYTDITFIDELGTSYTPTTLQELYQFVPNVKGLMPYSSTATPTNMTILTGSGLSDPMPNGTQSNFNITVAGVTSANLISINVTNAGSFPAGVIVVQETLIANDTIEIVLENQSGNNIPAQTVNIAVITS